MNSSIRAWIDYESEIIRFPVWALNGALIGYQRYVWFAPKIRSNDSEGRYITKIREAHQKTAFWGLEYFDKTPKILFVTEGIWDAIRCINAGYSCIAAFTATPSKQLKAYLRLLNPHRPIVVICDNDDAGKKLAKLGDFSFTPSTGKDMSDMSPEQAQEFLDRIYNEVIRID